MGTVYDTERASLGVDDDVDGRGELLLQVGEVARGADVDAAVADEASAGHAAVHLPKHSKCAGLWGHQYCRKRQQHPLPANIRQGSRNLEWNSLRLGAEQA